MYSRSKWCNFLLNHNLKNNITPKIPRDYLFSFYQKNPRETPEHPHPKTTPIYHTNQWNSWNHNSTKLTVSITHQQDECPNIRISTILAVSQITRNKKFFIPRLFVTWEPNFCNRDLLSLSRKWAQFFQLFHIEFFVVVILMKRIICVLKGYSPISKCIE